jgi:hypothetical protein
VQKVLQAFANSPTGVTTEIVSRVFNGASGRFWTAFEALPPGVSFQAELERYQEKRAIEGADGAVPVSRFISIASVLDEHVDWITALWVARGKLHMVDGDKGCGKSTLVLDALAAWTRGRGWLGGAPRPPAVCAIVAQEDGLGDTVKPRLVAADADLSKVLVLPVGEVPTFPEFVSELEAAIVAHGIQFLSIDSVMSTLGDLNSHKDQDVRTALMPLRAMLERTGCTAFAIRHLNKMTGASAAHRGMGSVAFASVARLVWLLGPDPEQPGRFVMSRSAGNLGRTPRSRTYTLTAGSDTSADVRIAWGEESDQTADTLVAPPRPGPRPETLEHAKGYLRDLLSSGPKSRREVLEAAAKVRLAEKTVQRAAKDLGILSLPSGKERLWALP